MWSGVWAGLWLTQKRFDDLLGGGGIMPLPQFVFHLLRYERISNQFRHRSSELIGPQLRLHNHARRSRLRKSARVVVLMIVRRRRIRNENGGHLHGGDFGKRRRTRSTHRNARGTERHFHLAKKGKYFGARGQRFVSGGYTFVIRGSGDV